ncbi:MAG: hypothetical protein BWY04_01436 [candidate division CPR1 bacterium ADurb.Bin160]|uniref:Uncharacterized protein n=1 Tax=candidate division CPR1 bacterium ADurb.Bin160 TaxID=1852826 RepID=A0A1V5ZIT6_9BACT|nr:MAG: hypothetical protein BWY04_01436 [candidate division CPR1 bacterium ADurb.Bin160]
MKSNRRKKNVMNDNTYVLNYVTKPKKCTNCGKVKPLLYYKVKNKLWNKVELSLCMCKECIEELKLYTSVIDEKDKQQHKESMMHILSEMLKEYNNVHK